MSTLSWSKKYYIIISVLGFIISFVIGILIGTEGIIWKTQENERDNMQLELAKYETAKELRLQIDNLYQNIFKLNDEYLIVTLKDSSDKNKKLLFKNKLYYLLENFESYEKKLSKLEERTKRKLFIPNPLTQVIERPSTPTGVGLRLKNTPGLLEQEVIIKVWFIFLSILIYAIVLLSIIILYIRRRQKKV